MKKCNFYEIINIFKILVALFFLLVNPKSDKKKDIIELYRALKIESRRWKKYLDTEDVELLGQRATDLKRFEGNGKLNEVTLEAILDDVESLISKVPESIRAKKIQILIDNLR